MISVVFIYQITAIVFASAWIVLLTNAIFVPWSVQTKINFLILSILCLNVAEKQIIKIKLRNIEIRLEQRGEDSP